MSEKKLVGLNYFNKFKKSFGFKFISYLFGGD